MQREYINVLHVRIFFQGRILKSKALQNRYRELLHKRPTRVFPNAGNYAKSSLVYQLIGMWQSFEYFNNKTIYD